MSIPNPRSRRLLLLLLLAFSVQVHYAFVPSSRRASPLLLGSNINNKNGRSALPSRSSNSTAPATIVVKSTVSDNEVSSRGRNGTDFRPATTISTNNNDDNNCLELDSLGRLRLCHRPDILLQGLDPTTWSSSRPKSGANNALFLHTNHPEQAAFHQTSLGSLISCRRLLACARQNRYWMGPKTGASAEDIPFDTQFLLIEIEEDHQYALLLPLVDNGFRASLSHGDTTKGDGSSWIDVVCSAESGDAAVTSTGMRALYVAVGSDPFQLVKEGLANVAEAMGTFDVLDNKKIPSSVDEFGWCTWDAFYSKVDPAGILKGVQALREAGVPPRNVILDDGWQVVNPMPSAWMDTKDVVAVSEDKGFLGEILSSIVDAIANPFVKMVTAWYENVVRVAPHGSLPNKIWSALANTVLKPGLWSFFDSATDFNRQLDGFEANHKFESNTPGEEMTLKALVSELKDDHGVKSVYCWHALHGYWRGVSEELGRKVGLNVINSFPKPTKSLLTLEPHSGWDPVTLWGVGVMTTKEDLEKFYTHLHTPLVEAGVDGVKVDVQSGVSSAGDGVGGGPHISKLYMKAMEASVSKRFPSENGGVNVINCMCHSTENIYRHKITSIARASEDFFPGRPESHTAHLVNVAYNSLFLGEICLPDWDMFHSLHESAELHGAARAIGGCPVYVSDKPGEHNPELLKKLVMPDGSVLRAKQPGRPTRDCLFADVTDDNKTALKIWNVNPGGGVVGAFNVQGVAWNFDTNENEVLDASPGSVTTQVKPYDIEYLRDTPGPFVAWRHRAKKLDFLEDGDTVMKETLQHRDWEVFTVSSIQIKRHLMWAPIGLQDMMNSGGALVAPGTLEEVSGAQMKAQFQSRGPGKFVAFTNAVPSKVFVGGAPTSDLPFEHDNDTGVLSFVLPPEVSEGKAHTVTVEWS